MPNLTINFEFLCAFVPPAPFSTGPKNCYVVLPDFTAPPKTHLPVLLYDIGDRADHLLTSGLAAARHKRHEWHLRPQGLRWLCMSMS